MKTIDEVRQIIEQVEFKDRRFEVGELGDGFYVQVLYEEADVDTGVVETQRARRWFIEPDSSETQIVETVFKACRVSNDHVLKEHFTYQGRRVYSPHFHIQARMTMSDACAYDGSNLAAWDDQPLPGVDEMIKAAHPTRSGKHTLFQRAQRLVGARRSKGGLVELVNWLLVEVEAAKGRRS